MEKKRAFETPQAYALDGLQEPFAAPFGDSLPGIQRRWDNRSANPHEAKEIQRHLETLKLRCAAGQRYTHCGCSLPETQDGQDGSHTECRN